MTPEEKASLLARLNDIIDTFEHSEDDERIDRAKEDLIDLWPDLLESVPIIGRMLEGKFGDAENEMHSQSVEKIRESTLPMLKQYRDFLARGVGGVGGAPENRPNRPGCFGGTGAVFLVLAFGVLSRLF